MKRLFPLVFLLTAISVSVAQNEPKKQEQGARPASTASEAPHQTAYKLEFKLFEMDDGKRINQRDFALMANAFDHAGPSSTLRSGTRVPVSIPGEKPNYIDVGFTVNCQLVTQGNALATSIRMEVSSFALPEQSSEAHPTGMPVLRSSNLNVDTVITPGKPQVIASIDDVNSKKRMQVELTATRLD
jgi:hypothetical protein